ncbi:MAG: PQQ-dependent sugar dehydrogenase [Labilithrix sp.]|nr:PQQ-dependent sugar dehydrogenase [Labilithrix sp.]
MRHILGLSLVTAIAIAAVVACGSDDTTVDPPPGGDDGGSLDGQTPPTRAEFGLDTRPANATCKAPSRPPSTAPVELQRVFAGVNLGTPMMMAQIPGNSTKWYIAQRAGTIASFPTVNPGATPTQVANLATIANGGPVQQGGEGGLLGMAFHPNFAANGRLYVTWMRTGGPANFRSEVGYLTSPDGGLTFTTYTPILGPFNQPAGNHNGGGIAFGKDGFLYLTFGDGGGGDDQFVKGQLKTEFFSKVLRIDVDNVPGGSTYGIPNDNPFKNGGGEPATFAYGLRNPFRFSIDRETGEVWAADVGQNKWEEVNQIKLGGNYGWPCKEGFHDYITGAPKCPSASGLLDPVVEIEHIPANTRSITGGFVYRGKAIPSFVGTYVFGDYEAQEIYTLELDTTTGEAKATQLADAPAANWASFAEDTDGELYAVGLNGQMYKIVAKAGAPASNFPDRLSKTGCADPADVKRPATGLVPYGVIAQLWSDGAEKDRFIALPDGAKITVRDDGDFDFPNGTVLVKTFSIGGKKIETRLLVRHDDGGWAGYTYEWLDDESDAVFLPGSKRKTVGSQTWHYPSRGECVRCHTEPAGRSLGLELPQLNGDFTYVSTNRISNQLKTLEHIDMFDKPLGKPVEQIAAYPDPLGTGPVEGRARAYLHANCSHCHRENGGGRGNMVLTFATSLKDTVTCNVDPEAGDLGIAGAKLIVPGDPAKSLLSVRPHALGANRMPPIASSLVDTQGVAVLDDWIRSVTACPP